MRVFSAIALSLIAAPALRAQSLAQRVASADGQVQVIYASRSTVCGDGESYIDHLFGTSRYEGSTTISSGRAGWRDRPCVHGPARVVATDAAGRHFRSHVNRHGQFRIRRLPPGTYTLSFHARYCRARWTVANVVVRDGRTVVPDNRDRDICVIVT